MSKISITDNYQIFDEIGHGAQGKIFTAIRKSDGRYVAIKQLNVSSVKTWKEYVLFRREAEVLESINIPGVAKFYDAIECLEDEPPCSYIVQEYIPGVTLQKMIKDGHRFKMQDIYDIIIRTLEILNQLHHHEPPVIHRDIKPSNLMISPDRDGRFKVTIIDFGAVANPQIQGGGSTVAGTYGYMPPEQLMGKPCPASDIYALAAVAVQLISGKSPADMPTKDFRLIFEPEMQDKPHELVTTLRQMLEPKVEDRLSDIPKLINIFTHYREQRYKYIIGDSHQQSSYGEDYEERLAQVEHVGEAGNMELWQMLSDALPREVPNAILECILHPEKQETDRAVFDNRSDKETIQLRDNIKRSLFRVQLKDVLKNLVSLIEEGRKAIATITHIEYMPADPNEVEYYQKRLVNLGRPQFKVQYKFNPPDDVRKEDIIHSFVTYDEPEYHYQVGDPLPILYLIEDMYFGDTVRSMPYPLPFLDIQRLIGIVGESNGNLDDMMNLNFSAITDQRVEVSIPTRLGEDGLDS